MVNKAYRFLLLSVLLFSLFISCTKQQFNDNNSFEVYASTQCSQTRTSLNSLSLSWSTGDALGVIVDGIQSNIQFKKYGDNTFMGVFEKVEQYSASVEYYAYYPYSLNAKGTVITATLPNTQTAPFDGKCDAMVADILSLPYNENSMPSLSFSFCNHMNAIVKMTISNSNAEYASEKITKVVLESAGSTMAGSYTFDVSKGSGCYPVYSGTKYDNVTVKFSTQPSLIVGDDIVLYAVVKSGTYSNLKLTIYTTTYSGGRSAKYNVTFERGSVTSLPPIDFGKLLTGASAVIGDLESDEYSNSDFWK